VLRPQTRRGFTCAGPTPLVGALTGFFLRGRIKTVPMGGRRAVHFFASGNIIDQVSASAKSLPKSRVRTFRR
jgi:hypothetical protein